MTATRKPTQVPLGQLPLWPAPKPTLGTAQGDLVSVKERRQANAEAKKRFVVVSNRAIEAGVLTLDQVVAISRRGTRKQGVYVRALKDLEDIIQAKLRQPRAVHRQDL